MKIVKTENRTKFHKEYQHYILMKNINLCNASLLAISSQVNTWNLKPYTSILNNNEEMKITVFFRKINITSQLTTMVYIQSHVV